ncbi:polysaccharide deacetylase family protein [Oscillatoria laete-virens NRMC-F 0139]|nr:polysaccharide deacetylase family protein [Oscillatoria laete-virens]MDL5053135.1 polysaccharide deacetylase family protein [Oscillatoria laete-virens NRMC-F 0139]
MNRADFLKVCVGSMATAFLGAGASRAVASSTVPNIAAQHPYRNSAFWLNSGSTDGNKIALTFDDGPTPRITDRVLDELAARKLPATFFMIGKRIQESPGLAREVAAEGHELGNHTFTHPKLSALPETRAYDEIHRSQDIMADTFGYAPIWFRPPYGAFHRSQGRLAVDQNLGVVYWSVDPQDWTRPGAQAIASRVIAGARPGSIVLLHELTMQTPDSLPMMLDNLLERNFTFCKLSEILVLPTAA